MSTHTFLSISAIANIAGGASIAFGIPQSGSLQIALIVVGALVLLVNATWSFWKLAAMKRNLANAQDDGSRQTGFKDIDRILGSAAAFNNNNNSQAAEQELEEIRSLLEHIDLRKGGFDQQGNRQTCSQRLIGILKGYGRDLDTSVAQTHSCRRELQRAIEEIVKGAESQSDLMNQTTNAIEEMSGHILTVCDNAEQAAATFENVKTKANEGLGHFQQFVEEVKSFKKQAYSRERKVRQLAEHTKEIETIVQSIGSLSSRTDLLALNASIESVRAGEHGRGFALVAEEVRALAEQSAQAVQDITRRLEMIQLETQLGPSDADHDPLQVVLQRVNDTLEKLEQIYEVTEKSTDEIGGISQSSTKQLKLAQQIVETLEESTDKTQKNRSRAEGANWTAKSLGEAGSLLDKSLELFRRSGAIKPATSGEG